MKMIIQKTKKEQCVLSRMYAIITDKRRAQDGEKAYLRHYESLVSIKLGIWIITYEKSDRISLRFKRS